QLIVCAVSSGEKAVSSRAGMRRSAETSPFYSAWVESHELDLRAAVDALEARSLSTLGPLIEHSTFKMHACMWASRPPLRYLRGESVALLDLVESLRQQGLELWATMDAGPHVKVLCHRRDAERVREAIVASALCLKIYMLRPGPGLQLAERSSFEFGEEKR
ncbi:MAG: diphosphomevalonate decarboxylase, partial [Myxococcota bacterium]|nr:diphosphomevalonate decarboxylase [Myxococcota bacterium]